MKIIGSSPNRVDAFDKVTGKAKYAPDLLPPHALEAKVLHSTIANGWVREFDLSEAWKVEGVVDIVTCFDVPDIQYPTAGHPWSNVPTKQDICDRKLLNTRVRQYADDIAAVIAETELAAIEAVRKIKVVYEELPVILDVKESLENTEFPLHEERPDNIVNKTSYEIGDFEEAIKEKGLTRISGTYRRWSPTPHRAGKLVRLRRSGKIVVVSATQIPTSSEGWSGKPSESIGERFG